MTTWNSNHSRLLWERETGLLLDFTAAGLDDVYLREMAPQIESALSEMSALESGAIANMTENRMVGHYWLRAPYLAPRDDIAKAVRAVNDTIAAFCADIHSGHLCGEGGRSFCNLLLIGIGGSGLGPSFVADALQRDQRMTLYCIDNTDPDGMDRVFEQLAGAFDETLVIVVSKSGNTVETRNGMLETMRRYREAGLSFARHAVAVTEEDSALHVRSREEHWLATFFIWDWVGGRTSITSAVGLLPLQLLHIDTAAFLAGARDMDVATRHPTPLRNPGLMLALAWYRQTGGVGGHELVLLPYKDRLRLLANYLQQLVMESLGKEKDRQGCLVHQGLTVYGNKGSTDQHAYVQQLMAGPSNFCVIFCEVLAERANESPLLAENSTAGDYLQAFLLGTAESLSQAGRCSLTITLPRLDGYCLGALLALFERAVGYYASFININAYDQPAVEAGKGAARTIIQVKNQLLHMMRENPARRETAAGWAAYLAEPAEPLQLWRLLLRLAANPGYHIAMEPASSLLDSKFFWLEGETQSAAGDSMTVYDLPEGNICQKGPETAFGEKTT